jgi:predicted RNA binding protein YcfA (HicA-like mRNA interferase family)
MVEGKHLDQVQLEAGQRLRMKTLPIDPQKDLPIDTIESILTAALTLYRNGTIKIKK